MKAALAQLARVMLGLALLIAAWPSVAAAQQAVSATVTRVVDGDTVIARGVDGTESPVRLIGIDTPVLWSRDVIPSIAAPAQRR